MGAQVFKGYNILGEGTPQALIPILTGKQSWEIPFNTQKSDNDSIFCDLAYPFIWRNFTEKLNYTTLFNEDWPNANTFHYRMTGFSKPPTTHYSRPLHLAYYAEKRNKFYCHYGRSFLRYNLDYYEDFLHTYKDTGFFGMSHFNHYTHDEDFNDITWQDNDLFDFFQKFYNDRTVSDNTVLFVYSDHGPRYDKKRRSLKGLLNLRNPFFSVYIPPLFKQRYPNEYKSLTENTNKPVNAFDFHQTLWNIIDLETGHVKPRSAEKVYEKKRGLSLFSDIAPDRTCEDAAIPPYWSACLKKTKIQVDNYTRTLAQVFIDHINNFLLKDTLELCHRLEIDQVVSVYLMDSYLNKTHNYSQFETDFKRYIFSVLTKPNNGAYEFAITVQNLLKTLDEKQICRTNKYGDDEHCIHDKYPQLREYCYCRDKVTKKP
jgi:hypothetical protein